MENEIKSELNLKMVPNNTDDKVSIIIVHRDKPAYLNICLQSITVNSSNNNYETIIVDNGSESQDAKDFLDDLEKQDCIVVRNKENLWWTQAANLGAAAADKNSKYLIFLHYDVVVESPAWIDFLINVSESQDSGLVGVSMSSYTMDDVSGKKVKVDFIEEWCMLTTRECWTDCGVFDERLKQIGAPFLYTIKAQWANYKPQAIRNRLIHHYGVFSLDINDLERFNDVAMTTIPVLLREQQSKMKA